MVLKRLLATALGALGLGALAAGSAFGQTAGEGNIPAPDIFNDQIACSMFVPSAMSVPTPSKVPDGGMTSPLTDVIGMGTTAVTDNTTLGLGYIIPNTNSNCGAGATGPMFGAMNIDGNGDGDFVDAVDTYKVTSIPIDVADGYTALVDKYEAVYGDPLDATSKGTAGALAGANKALSDAIAAGTSGTALEPLQKAVTDAKAANDKAMSALTDASGGPVYQAGIAEWQAQAAVTNAIAAYNGQVTKTNTALTELNALRYKQTGDTNDADTSKYVPLGNGELVGTVVTIDMGMGTVVLTELIQYTNSDLNATTPQVGTPGMVGTGDGSGSDDDNLAPAASDTTHSNFTAAGVLIVPMQPDTTTADALDLRTTKSTSNLISEIRTTVTDTNIAAAALKKARDENTNQQTQAVYDEAYRRAQLEADYYNRVWQEVLSDTTDQRTQTQKDATGDAAVKIYSISSRNTAYVNAENKRFTNETTLRTAVADREAATLATIGAFNSPQSFYDQLIARRTALKVTADRAVTAAQKDGGTASKTLTDAADNAQKALEAAQKVASSFSGLYDDPDDPTVALMDTLLKTGGDDGQALVDAISSNYGTANAAKETADAVAASVEDLVGDGGAVSQNTAAIAVNAEGILTNAGNIATNATNIAANAEGIVTNATNIATNATNIAANAEGIVMNAEGIMANSGRIDANESAIGVNTGAITDNANAIGRNTTSINGLRGDVSGLQDQMEVVRAGVAASMALAGMPAINGRGISIGVGSYDGESAFAVGFQIQSEMASFKVGVTSAGGETGASAGVGFQF